MEFVSPGDLSPYQWFVRTISAEKKVPENNTHQQVIDNPNENSCFDQLRERGIAQWKQLPPPLILARLN